MQPDPVGSGIGADDEEAQALALPWYISWVRGRARMPGQGLMPVEAALSYRFSAAERDAEHLVARQPSQSVA
jgi:hypothetical protein